MFLHCASCVLMVLAQRMLQMRGSFQEVLVVQEALVVQAVRALQAYLNRKQCQESKVFEEFCL